MKSEVNEVINFLKRFKTSDDIKEVFTCDCSYWFAVILFGRFIRDGATIMYDKNVNHFGTRIGGRIYDITGDVTGSYVWVTWESITDKSQRASITQNCIMF